MWIDDILFLFFVILILKSYWESVGKNWVFCILILVFWKCILLVFFFRNSYFFLIVRKLFLIVILLIIIWFEVDKIVVVVGVINWGVGMLFSMFDVIVDKFLVFLIDDCVFCFVFLWMVFRLEEVLLIIGCIGDIIWFNVFVSWVCDVGVVIKFKIVIMSVYFILLFLC